jgi:preprotein translocase SecE subunit
MALIDYLKETKAEMKHVSWPTQAQVLNYTLVVLALGALTGVFLGFFDFLFSTGLKDLILK